MELDQIPVDPFGLQEVEPSASASIPTEDADDRSYSAKMLQSMAEMQKKGHFCDVTLRAKVSQEDFKVHSLILVAASPYIYEHLLSSGICEEGRTMCRVPVTSSCIRALLSYLYTGEVRNTLDITDIHDLHGLADEWQMEDLKDLSLELLRSPFPSGKRKKYKRHVLHDETISNNLQRELDSEVDLSLSVETPVKTKRSKKLDPNRPKKYVGAGVKIPPGVIEERIERPFTCRMCKADFADRSNCIEHISSNHHISEEHINKFLSFPSTMPKCYPAILPKRYRCGEEGCAYNSIKVLPVLMHRLTVHNIPIPEERINQVDTCKICGRICKTKSAMKYHMAKHSKIRPFMCEVCAMSFDNKPALRKHMICCHKVGDSDAIFKYTFPCPHCNFVAKRMYQFRAHMLEHGDGASLRCHYCDYVVTSNDLLKTHILNEHSVKKESENMTLISMVDEWAAGFDSVDDSDGCPLSD